MLGSIIWTAGKGLLAGAAGTAAMTLSSTLEMRLRHRPPSRTPAYAAESVLDIEPEDDASEEQLSQATHWVYGAAWGLPRIALETLRIRGRNADLLHFGAMWGSALVMLPALRATPPPVEWGTQEISIDAFHHLVYAIGAGAAWDVVKHI